MRFLTIAEKFLTNSRHLKQLIWYMQTSLNIAQKHSAFKEIINDYPDMEIIERPWVPYSESLHCFLQNYMELQNKYFDIFYKDEPNCVYSFDVRYSCDDNYCEDDRLFLSFSACYKAIKNDIDELVADYTDIYPIAIRVKKQWLNNADDEQSKYIVVCIDYDNNPVDIWDTHSIISSEDNEILRGFEGLWPEIPTPFKKGDILTARCINKKDEKPFVLDWIPYWEENGKYTQIISCLRESGDSSDLIISAYFLDDDGVIWRDHGPSYLNLEYYEEKLNEDESFLLALSEYIKNDFPLDLLMRSYDISRTERHVKNERCHIANLCGELLKETILGRTKNL